MWLKKALIGVGSFFGRQMPAIVSVLSLFVACLSLYFTTQAQKVDREYKEVSIKPSLAVAADVHDFAFKYINFGLGPAIFTRVRFGLNGKCYDTHDNIGQYEQQFPEFMEKTMRDLVSKLPVDPRATKSVDTAFSTTPISAETVVRPGAEFIVIQLDPDSLKEVQKLPISILYPAKNAFSDAGSKIPLSVEYCSATGLYCEILNTQNETCAIPIPADR